jgi:hypothetical protein
MWRDVRSANHTHVWVNMVSDASQNCKTEPWFTCLPPNVILMAVVPGGRTKGNAFFVQPKNCKLLRDSRTMSLKLPSTAPTTACQLLVGPPPFLSRYSSLYGPPPGTLTDVDVLLTLPYKPSRAALPARLQLSPGSVSKQVQQASEKL